jgi:predicted NBD/HSP70 family sugar kinase
LLLAPIFFVITFAFEKLIFEMQYEDTESKNRNISKTVRLMIAKHIMKYGKFTIPQIAKDTGFSLTTIAKYVSNGLSLGLIKELDPLSSGRKGRRANVFGVSSDLHLFAGVDIKSFGLSIAIIDFLGNILVSEKDESFKFDNTYNTMKSVCISVEKFFASAKEKGIDVSRIMGITFNVSGRVNTDLGTSASVFNFEETKDTPLAQILSERFGTQVFVMNDTKALTYAEFLHLKGKYNDMLYINAGWGLGLGIVVNGQLYYGKDGYSGEFGHNPGYNNNILCHCGKKGCIETEISGSAISRKIIERVKKGESSILSETVKNREYLTPDEIINAVEKEDPLTIDIVSQIGNELGRHLAGLLNIFNPEIIVIGGSLSQIPSVYFLKQIEVTIYKYSLRLMSQNVPIVYSDLGENAGVLGACLVARSRCYGV